MLAYSLDGRFMSIMVECFYNILQFGRYSIELEDSKLRDLLGICFCMSAVKTIKPFRR